MALVNKQPYVCVDVDTHKNFPFLPTQLLLMVQHKDAGPWTYGTMEGHGSVDHNN